jgi:predicted nucleotidyltransferase component of viral defense system
VKRSRDRGSAASVHDRLLARAHADGEEFQRVLVRYAIERFLYRLSGSPHAGMFILKGATLFSVWTGAPHRTTKDVDLLGFGAPEEARIAAIMREVMEAEVEPDGLAFDATSIRVAPIREDAEYDGLRVVCDVKLGTARIGLQVDVGFGDVLALPADEVEVPTLLDLPAPRLRAYRREQVVAEKLHAMVDLGLVNTRLKDYFDIHVLSRSFAFDGADLARAITATFARRRTPVPTDVPIGLSDDFAHDAAKQRQWTAFLKRTGAKDAPSLAEVVRSIGPFLLEPLDAAAAGGGFHRRWPAGGSWQ